MKKDYELIQNDNKNVDGVDQPHKLGSHSQVGIVLQNMVHLWLPCFFVVLFIVKTWLISEPLNKVLTNLHNT